MLNKYLKNSSLSLLLTVTDQKLQTPSHRLNFEMMLSKSPSQNETYVRLIIPIHSSTNSENCMNIGPVNSDIFAVSS